MLEPSDPAAAALTQAIRTGDITALEQLLADRLALATDPGPDDINEAFWQACHCSPHPVS